MKGRCGFGLNRDRGLCSAHARWSRESAHMPAIPRTTSLTRWSCWSLTRTQHTLQALLIWSFWIRSTWDRLLCWSYKEISWVQSWFGDYNDCRHARCLVHCCFFLHSKNPTNKTSREACHLLPTDLQVPVGGETHQPVAHGQVISYLYDYVIILIVSVDHFMQKIQDGFMGEANLLTGLIWSRGACMYVGGKLWVPWSNSLSWSQSKPWILAVFFFSRKTTLALSSTAISLVELLQLEWVEGSSWPEPRRGCRDVQEKTNSKTPPWKIRNFQKWKDRILSNHWFSEVNC